MKQLSSYLHNFLEYLMAHEWVRQLINQLSSYLHKFRAYLTAHKWARIACIVLVVFLVLHPYGRKTFLILGMDNYGSLDNSGRSDVIMLVQVDFTRTKLSAVTFARDMFVENENGNLTKINTIVRNHDEKTLCETIERNFGVSIDGWFRVNFTSVIQLVDAIGGAHVELTQNEANYINNKAGRYPEYPLSEGVCHLNGAQALTYARCRSLDNDLGRGQRQSKLLSAMVDQTRRMTAANVVAVFGSLKHAWRSSLSVFGQAALIPKALWLRGADVERISMPFEGYYRYGSAGGSSGLVADLEDNRRLLLESLGLPQPRSTVKP